MTQQYLYLVARRPALYSMLAESHLQCCRPSPACLRDWHSSRRSPAWATPSRLLHNARSHSTPLLPAQLSLKSTAVANGRVTRSSCLFVERRGMLLQHLAELGKALQRGMTHVRYRIHCERPKSGDDARCCFLSSVHVRRCQYRLTNTSANLSALHLDTCYSCSLMDQPSTCLA